MTMKTARQVQIRRGTADEHNTFVGAIGEITMDTTNKTIRVHDGQTPGGIPLAKENDAVDYVIETQLPTAENNYTWYRKYKSGWIEQGGYADGDTNLRNSPVVLPITMANDKYCINATTINLEGAADIETQTHTGFTIYERVWVGGWFYHNFRGYWHVSGFVGATE